MKVCYVCNDDIRTFARGEVCKTVSSWDEACSERVWEQAKLAFARRCHTRKAFVKITSVRVVDDDYKPVR